VKKKSINRIQIKKKQETNRAKLEKTKPKLKKPSQTEKPSQTGFSFF
jgi:hypothetical protein